MRSVAVIIVFSVLLGIGLWSDRGFQEAFGVGLNELQQAIDAKTKELEGVSKQIQKTQGELEKIGAEKKSLSRDIKSFDHTIGQLNLSIKSSEINIEKLKLELELLENKKAGTEQVIGSQKEAIAQVLRVIQQKDSEGLIHILLKRNSLAESLLEMQSLEDLQNNLSINVNTLINLHNELNQNIVSTDQAKNNLENENSNLKYRKVITDDKKAEKKELLATTNNKESVYQKQLTKLEKDQQAIFDEISRIEEDLRAQFDPSALPSAKSGLLSWPIALKQDGGGGIISQHYGETAYSRRFYKGRPHNGTDIAAPIGTPIYAADGGIVSRVDYNGLYYQYGRYILIQHANNFTTLYAHLSRSAVSDGQIVKRGELIGYVGSTGLSTGPHLHFGLYITPAGGWRKTTSAPGLLSIPPASGLVPVGMTINPEDYL